MDKIPPARPFRRPRILQEASGSYNILAWIRRKARRRQPPACMLEDGLFFQEGAHHEQGARFVKDGTVILNGESLTLEDVRAVRDQLCTGGCVAAGHERGGAFAGRGGQTGRLGGGGVRVDHRLRLAAGYSDRAGARPTIAAESDPQPQRGVGKPATQEVVRAMLLLRANTLAKGYSGVRPLIIERLAQMLNRRASIRSFPCKARLGPAATWHRSRISCWC